MSFELLGSPILAALVALAPGFFYWWEARALIRAIDDPVLPERLLNLQRRSSAIFVLAIVVLFVLSSIVGPGSAGLVNLVLGASAPGHHAPRGSLPPAPRAVQRNVEPPRPISPSPSARSSLCQDSGCRWRRSRLWPARWSSRLGGWRRHRCRAAHLERALSRTPAIALRCGAHTGRCTDGAVQGDGGHLWVGNTQFEVLDLRGGAVLNAVALPSVRQPAVVFTDTMLRRLDLTRSSASARTNSPISSTTPRTSPATGSQHGGMITFGVLVAPFARLTGWSSLLVLAIWVMCWLGFLLSLARNRQKNETESDRRAISLTGDPEALVRALTKAYAFNRFPRRLDAEFERHATHPSLARRIRDIRAAANQAPAPFIDLLSVTCVDGSVLMLDDARVSWTDPDGTTHAVPYEQVVELRFDVANRRGPQLVVVQKSGPQMAVRRERGGRGSRPGRSGPHRRPVGRTGSARSLGGARPHARRRGRRALAYGRHDRAGPCDGPGGSPALVAVPRGVRLCSTSRGRDYATRSADRRRTADRHQPLAHLSWRRVDIHGHDDIDLPADRRDNLAFAGLGFLL